MLYETQPSMCCGGSSKNSANNSSWCTCCHVYNLGVVVPDVMPRGLLCNVENVLLPCVKDAESLAAAINQTRDERLAQQNIKIEYDFDR